MESITAFLNKTFRPTGCCCCFTLKVGTNIIGVVEIIFNIIGMFSDNITNVYGKNSAEGFDYRESKVLEIAFIILRSLWIVATIAMICGNMKGNRKMMLVYLYAKFVALILIVLVGFLVMASYFILLEFFAVLVTGLINFIQIALFGYMWHVVACRNLEIEETARPDIENVPNTLVKVAEEPPVALMLKDPMNPASAISGMPH